MARKLKTFQTSLGFYDLAVAAPSMKAALDESGGPTLAGSSYARGEPRSADTSRASTRFRHRIETGRP
jgi:hypothetical protein